MTKPAARLGDTTVHGGVITVGAPTVLIGGAPAARVSDMHMCPMLNPGTPPPPHVGGPILLGSPTVLICGQMAARMGDMAQCSGPPDSIAMGCPTVLIGESTTAGAGAPGAGGGSSADTGVDPTGTVAAAVASAAGAGDNHPTEEGENHFLDVKFVDKGGFPIHGVHYKIKDPESKESLGALSGQIKKTGIKPGNYEIELKTIVSAAWSKKEARTEEVVKLTAEVVGYPSGTDAVFEIWERDMNDPDDFITRIETKTKGNKVEAEWEYEYIEDEDDIETAEERNKGYSAPEYYFIVKVESSNAKSGLLRFKDYIEITLSDEDDNPIPNEEYIVCLSNGEMRKGKLDDKGYAKIENVPPAAWSVRFPNSGDLYEED